MSLINVTNLTFAYEGSYQNIFENVNFQIDTDWKLGFTEETEEERQPFSICFWVNMNIAEVFLRM